MLVTLMVPSQRLRIFFTNVSPRPLPSTAAAFGLVKFVKHMFLHLFSHANAGICSPRVDREKKVAPDRALNLKDIYVKMQACVFCACIFEPVTR